MRQGTVVTGRRVMGAHEVEARAPAAGAGGAGHAGRGGLSSLRTCDERSRAQAEVVCSSLVLAVEMCGSDEKPCAARTVGTTQPGVARAPVSHVHAIGRLRVGIGRRWRRVCKTHP